MTAPNRSAPTDRTSLLPCPSPWCERALPPRPIRGTGIGGKPRWFVICDDCDMCGPIKDAKAEAIAAWNTRPTQSELPTDRTSREMGPVTISGELYVERAEAEFTDYFVRNYPGPDTIIHDPRWHAPKIFRAARHALLAAFRTALSSACEGVVARAAPKQDGEQ